MLRRNVLLFHLGAIGDFVLTWPLAMALGRLYAQSRVIYVTHGQKGALAERVLNVESTDIEAGWHQLFAAQPNLPESATKLLNGAHTIVCFFAKSDETWMRNVLASGARADLIPIEPRPPRDYRGHFTDFCIEQLGPWPALQASAGAMMRAIQSSGILPSSGRSETIVVHPGSGGEHKCWPRERFLQLIHRLREQGRTVRVLLGEVELEKWPTDVIRGFESAAEVVRPASLVELFDHLSTAGAAVMNDSGPAHLAAITGTPTVVLFGSSNPTVWRPIGPRVELLHQNPIETIEVDRVYDRLMSILRG